MASELLVPESCTGPKGSSGVDSRRVANADDSPCHVGMEKKKKNEERTAYGVLFPINPRALYFAVHCGKEPPKINLVVALVDAILRR